MPRCYKSFINGLSLCCKLTFITDLQHLLVCKLKFSFFRQQDVFELILLIHEFSLDYQVSELEKDVMKANLLEFVKSGQSHQADVFIKNLSIALTHDLWAYDQLFAEWVSGEVCEELKEESAG